MTISSSLNAGVQGLSVNATRLGTISNNIANSDTYGYKRVDTEFVSLVLPDKNTSYSAGGVRVLTTRDVSTEGSLITTGSATDLAISGRGFLPVTTIGSLNDANTDLLLTTTGSFYPDEDGVLRTASGLVLLGWEAEADGSLGGVTRQGSGDLEPVTISTSQFQSSPTTLINLGVNLPADETEVGGSGDSYQISAEYYDNLGRSQTITAEFTPVIPASGSSNAWSVELFDNSSGSPVSVSTFDISFIDDPVNGGAVNAVTNNGTYDPSTGNITVTLPSGDIEVKVGAPGEVSSLTQFAADFAPGNLTKDGAAIGDLESIEIDDLGRLQAIYDTGYRQILYYIPVGDVQNPDGLIAENNQAFSLSQDSGDLYLWDAGTGPVGQTVGFSLMESTTDVASELTALIETQQAYSSNAKIIQTVDEMLQETNNIVR